MKNHPTRLRIVSLILCICMIAAGLAACGEKKPTVPELKGAKLSHEPEFGGVYIELSIEEFNKLGFNYGDSVDISFSNGVTLEGLPYYNGYYTLNGQPLLVAYPGYPYIKACINSGADLWTVSGLSDTDTADVKLNTAGAFLDIQQARDIHYQDDRSKFPTDAVFANFRNIKAGNIKEGRIYRSASPCDNQHQYQACKGYLLPGCPAAEEEHSCNACHYRDYLPEGNLLAKKQYHGKGHHYRIEEMDSSCGSAGNISVRGCQEETRSRIEYGKDAHRSYFPAAAPEAYFLDLADDPHEK